MRTILSRSALPPVSKQEERVLLNKIQNGSDIEKEQAQELLLRSNLKLIFKIADEFKDKGVPIEDLVSEGSRGMMYAMTKFDLTQDVRFISYAAHWIRQKMRIAIEKQGRVVTIPADAFIKKAQVLNTRSRLTKEWGREPTVKELSTYMKVPEDKIRNRLYSLGLDIRLDEEDTEENTTSHIDLSSVDNTWEIKENDEQLELMEACITKLPERSQYILRMRFGYTGKEATLEEVGQEIGCCRERVRQLQEEAISSLKHLVERME